MGPIELLVHRIRTSQLWRAIFRVGYPETPREQSLIIMSNVFLHLHPVKMRAHAIKVTYSFCVGALTFFLFLVLTVTGVLLMFYYRPTVEHAYADMQALETSVNFGMLMRNLHRWTAHGMVISVFLHMARVFYTGSYKPPREFNWMVGVVLLTITLLLSFTGYLLPWDQLSFWAVTVGTNLAGYAPLVGAQTKFLLLGGYEVGANTLLRFYVLHVIAFPLLAALLMAVHFWRIRKDGGISGPL